MLNYSAAGASVLGVASGVVSSTAGVQDSSVQGVLSAHVPSVQVFSVAGATVQSTGVVVSSDIIKRIGNRVESIAGSRLFQEFLGDICLI